ncbi:hypothetical protein BK662_14875 [Pseudomonas frederiksbergensis]|uniref:Uncharacterized protein n=1 Tax=Pseudomonas frederiksbergensis TaxID=104087 RepID=A0A423HQE4_9PSED|nr:hypothetical protein BK662_14875 [Pseudomonas frederiksbergensis]
MMQSSTRKGLDGRLIGGALVWTTLLTISWIMVFEHLTCACTETALSTGLNPMVITQIATYTIAQT